MALFEYMKSVQRLVHDSRIELIDPADLIIYINTARRQVAMQSLCLRCLTPISGSVASISVIAHGSGYTAPTITITPPDFPGGGPTNPGGLQATASIAEHSGTISGISVTNPGAGYFEPLVIINDPHGTGAVAAATLSPINQLNENQEVYPFSNVNLSAFPGVASIFTVQSVSIIYANYRYSLPIYSFSTYQALIRNYPFQYQYVPTIGAQYGRGVGGSFYLYPIASQTYQMEFDCFCLPSDLLLDTDVEAIPEPWTDAVKYFAAHLAYLELQNFNSAKGMLDLFDEFLRRYNRASMPGRATNPYGRYSFLLTAGLSSALLALTGIIA